MTESELKPTGFDSLNLIEPLLRAIRDSGYTEPSPIQAQTIPHVLAGTDVLGQAQTGTGKTAAFALPTLQKIDTKSKNVQVLVLAPTRELANQVAASFKIYSKYIDGVNVLPIYGGADYGTQLRGLKNGAHIVVGTPGRVMDHIERGTLKLDNLNTLVLDEADEMLRMGFIDDVEWILSKSPKEKQITLFSATMPRQIQTITERYLRDEVVVKIESKTQTAATIEQFHVGVDQKQKSTALRRVLEIEETDAVIIFVNTKAATEDLAEMLNRRGYRTAALNGDLAQKQRERVIEQIKTGGIDIILATDVAARGLDVERISHVINYDLPRDNESYVHRIGRTGRAGRSGRAILIVSHRDRRAFGFLQKDTKTTIPPYDMPDLETINARRIERFKKRILDESEHKKLGYLEELLADMHKESDIDPFAMAAALASMVLGKTPLLLNKKEAVETFDMQQQQSGRQRDRNDRGRDRNDSNAKRRKSNNERGGRREERGDRIPLSEMQRFRLSVGYQDNVRPGHVVGAIANEGGIDGSQIGPIDIGDNHTEVMLPKDLPKEALEGLKKARIMGKPMNIEIVEGGSEIKGKRERKQSDDRDRSERPKRARKSDQKPASRHHKKRER